MIAIPNMEKPEKCGNCQFFELVGVFELEEDVWVSKFRCRISGTDLGTDANSDCPLTDLLGHTYYRERRE